MIRFESTVNYEEKQYVKLKEVLNQAKENNLTKDELRKELYAIKIKGFGSTLFVLKDDVARYIGRKAYKIEEKRKSDSNIRVRFEKNYSWEIFVTINNKETRLSLASLWKMRKRINETYINKVKLSYFYANRQKSLTQAELDYIIAEIKKFIKTAEYKESFKHNQEKVQYDNNLSANNTCILYKESAK